MEGRVGVGAGLKFMKPTRRTYYPKEDPSPGPVTWEIAEIERYNRVKKKRKKELRAQLSETHLQIFHTATKYLTAFQQSVNYMVHPALLSEQNVHDFLRGTGEFECNSSGRGISVTMYIAMALGARAMDDMDTMDEYWNKARDHMSYVFDVTDYTVATALHIMGVEHAFIRDERDKGAYYFFLAQKMCERLGALNSDAYLRYFSFEMFAKMHTMSTEDLAKAYRVLETVREMPGVLAKFPKQLEHSSSTSSSTKIPPTHHSTSPATMTTTTTTTTTSNTPPTPSILPTPPTQSTSYIGRVPATITPIVEGDAQQQQSLTGNIEPPQESQQPRHQSQPHKQLQIQQDAPSFSLLWSDEGYQNYQNAHLLIAQAAVNVAACAILRRQQEALFNNDPSAEDMEDYLERRKKIVEHIIIFMPRFEEEFDKCAEATHPAFTLSFKMFLYTMVADAFWHLGYVEHAHDYALRFLRLAQRPLFVRVYSSVPLMSVVVLKIFLERQNFVLMERLLAVLDSLKCKFKMLASLLEPFETALKDRVPVIKKDTTLKLRELID